MSFLQTDLEVSSEQVAEITPDQNASRFLPLIYAVLDGEASATECEDCQELLSSNQACQELYQLELTIKEAVRTRVKAVSAPTDLVHSIRLQVS